MDETEEVIRLCCRALVAQMNAAPGFELHMTHNCVLGFTSEPLPDFNMMTLGPDPDAAGFLTRAVARAREKRLPLLATMSPHVADALAPVAADLGLKPVGTVPLLVLRAATPVGPSRPVRVTRALGPERVAIAGDIAAAAFDSPRDVIARCIDVGVTETASLETYIAWDGETPTSAVTVTPTGNFAGISLMGTKPEHQGRGMGRALLTHVIGDYRGRGVTRFHLSTRNPVALTLYKSLGFEEIAELSAWILEA